ncbi:hypothetical protein FB561_6035 [Kribbella amoyensis]|uniref:Uncharacterized protein n=1 Tax=Kribbella amoyensis TaxID=996641 RepID=A0A561C0X6_9ACTN|nr:hypothetical protein [Kribbella amoyensis]TWD84839.1 hypothetical protein FB561_6035 [Kribbella amoyensis]
MTRVPAERTLAHKEEILRQVLAEEQRPAQRRGWLVPVAAAASIAALAGGVVGLSSLTGNHSDPAGQAGDSGQAGFQTTASAGTPSASAGPDVPLYRGRLNQAEIAAATKGCLKKVSLQKANKVLHPIKIADVFTGRSEPALVLRADTRTITCVGRSSGAGTTWDARAHKNLPDLQLSPGTTSVSSKKSVIDHVLPRSWTTVDDEAASVRRRILVNGQAGPWYVSKPIDGLALVQAKNDGPIHIGDKVTVETQQLDAAGKIVGKPNAVSATVTRNPAPGQAYPLLSFLSPR